VSHADWDTRKYHGRANRYPFTEVVAFVMRTFGKTNRSDVRILDLGFGGGHHLSFLAREGFDYYGIDGSDESLNIATEQLESVGFRTDTLTVGTFDDMPYDTDFFDCVIDRGSLVCNYLADLPPLIEETRRVLKPGGYLFSMILNEQSTVKDSARALGNSDYTEFQGRLEEAGVLHFTNASELRRLFAAFTIEDIELWLRRSEFLEPGRSLTTAWSILTCRK